MGGGTHVRHILINVFECLCWFVYNELTHDAPASLCRAGLTQSEAFFMGAMAKAIATVITYPYQVRHDDD